MKTKLFGWMTIMLLAFVCVGFAACGSDDDDDNGSGNSGTILVGKWAGDHSENYFEDWTFSHTGSVPV